MELLQEVQSGTSRSETHALIRALADADGETYSHSLQVAAMATPWRAGSGSTATS